MNTTALTPTTVAELISALGQMTPDSKIISGGSDLIIRLNCGLCTPDALLYMGGVTELCGIEQVENTVHIGAAATMAAIERSPLLHGGLAAIAHAASDVGSAQIRNNGTIGGNIGNASPAGDLLPPLFLLGAQVVIASPTGLRTAPIQEVIVGPGKTSLSYNEAVAKILVPLPSPRYRTAFSKLGFRRAVTISRIGLAVGVELGEDGIITSGQVMAGAISLVPISVPKAEALLPGRRVDDALKDQVGQALADLILEVTPEMFDRDYKVGAARGVAWDTLDKFS